MILLLSKSREFLQRWSGLGCACLGAGILTGVIGCTPAVTMEEEAAPSRATASAQPQAAVQDKPSQPAIKEASLEEQGFKLQGLSLHEDRGQTTVRVKFSSPVSQYRHFSLTQPSRVVLDVYGQAKRLAQVENFRAETHWLSILRLSSGEGYLRVVMEIAAAAVPAYTIEPEDGGLRIVIGPVNPQHTAQKDLPLVRNGKRVDVSVAQAQTAASGVSIGASGAQVKGEKTYTGQRLSLDFKDADIKNVFRLLAEVSGLNIVVTDEVKRRVTVRLTDVPWDQALDLLIDTNGLGKEQVGNVVRISTAGALRSERDALAAAKKAEENLQPLETAYFTVNYAKVKELVDKIKPVLSPRGVVLPDERSNTIVVRDIRRGIEEANAIASRLDVRTSQVLIESNLIETSPTFARALGMKFEFTRGAAIKSDFPGAGPAAGIDPVISIIQSRFAALRGLTAELTAAETEGLVRIISRPSVVTLNNVASTIQSLRILRIVLPTSTNIASGTGAAAGAAVATEKIPIGVILTVTPQVSSDGFILMAISVKTSSVAPSASKASDKVIPFDEISREAIANVLVRDGETIVLGGIMKDTKSTDESGIPWLKDIPVFGWLFKSMTWKKELEELMVFITPRIISAGSENLPTA